MNYKYINTLLLILTLYFLCSAFLYAKNTLTFNLPGLTGDLLTNSEAKLKAEQDSYPELSPLTMQLLYRHAPETIKQALAPYGFFKPFIQAISLTHRQSKWVATFRVHLGPAIKITQIKLQIQGPGSQDSELQKLAHNFPLKVGDTFQTTPYEAAKDKLFQTANNQGYAKAYLSNNKVLIDLKAYTAVIIFDLQTGPLYYFGPIHFEQTVYGQSFLQRFQIFNENETFSSEKLLKYQQDLTNSPYFKQVLVLPNFNKAENNHIPIDISATPPKAKQYSLGLGYGTFTGPRLTAGVSFRRIADTGQHFDAQLRLSSVVSGLAAKYYIPGANPLTEQWIIGTNYQKFNPQNGNSISRSLAAGYAKKIDDFQLTTNLNFLLERFSVYDSPNANSKLLYPNLTISSTHTDDPVNPQEGRSLSLVLQGAPETALSSTGFMQAELKGKYKWTPVDFAHLILRGDVGYTAVHHLAVFPLSTRFFCWWVK